MTLMSRMRSDKINLTLGQRLGNIFNRSFTWDVDDSPAGINQAPIAPRTDMATKATKT